MLLLPSAFYFILPGLVYNYGKKTFISARSQVMHQYIMLSQFIGKNVSIIEYIAWK